MNPNFYGSTKICGNVFFMFRSVWFCSRSKYLLIAGIILTLTGSVFAQDPHTNADSVMRAQQEWRFGVFLHFNMNTFYTGWANDRVDPKLFNPSKLDCGQWARTLKAAGMKFGMLYVKHHDGFTIWPSKAVPPNGKVLYTIAQSSVPNRDVVKEYCDSMRAYGLEPGLCYSPWDIANGVGSDNNWPKYKAFVLTQLTELLDGRYGEIPLFVTDAWDWMMGHYAIPYDVVKDTIRKMQPNCMLVNHHSSGSPWQADVLYFECPKGEASKAPPGNTIASIQSPTISGDWFWSAAAEDTNRLMTTSSILAWLKESEERYCNLALNCPPNRLGLMPDAIGTRLKQVAALWKPNLSRPPLPHQIHNIEYPIPRKTVTTSSNGTLDLCENPNDRQSVSSSAADGHLDIDGSGKEATYFTAKPLWQSATGLPQWAQLDLGVVYYNLNIFGYLPRRQTSNRAGSITSYRLLLSTDGTNFTEVARGKWDGKDYHYKTVEFTPAAGRYIRLVADSTCNAAGNAGGTFACINEIDVGGRLIRPTLDPVAVEHMEHVTQKPVSSSAPLTFRVFGNNVAVPQQLSKHITSVAVYDLSGKYITEAVVKNGIIRFKKQVAKSDNIYIIRIKQNN